MTSNRSPGLVHGDVNFEPSALFPETIAWPRISMITAVYNGEEYLEATIRSIIQQGYPNLDYIIIDDGSTDKTPEIIRKYEKHLSYWTSHANRGLYRSLNVGFARSTGDIMGWLNASDMLHVNSLFVVATVFMSFPEVQWITGRPTNFSAEGMPVEIAPEMPRWSRYQFLAGDNKAIQQESTFWRRGLWELAGGSMETAYRAEGDFELWVRFFQHAHVYPVDALIGGYRRHDNSLSSSNIERYNRTCDMIVSHELESVRGGRWIKLFRGLSELTKSWPIIGSLWYWFTIKALYPLMSRDRPPIIKYSGTKWVTYD
jgi:glycosyltransferase involved in cell wall biosynthesis